MYVCAPFLQVNAILKSRPNARISLRGVVPPKNSPTPRARKFPQPYPGIHEFPAAIQPTTFTVHHSTDSSSTDHHQQHATISCAHYHRHRTQQRPTMAAAATARLLASPTTTSSPTPTTIANNGGILLTRRPRATQRTNSSSISISCPISAAAWWRWGRRSNDGCSSRPIYITGLVAVVLALFINGELPARGTCALSLWPVADACKM